MLRLLLWATWQNSFALAKCVLPSLNNMFRRKSLVSPDTVCNDFVRSHNTGGVSCLFEQI